MCSILHNIVMTMLRDTILKRMEDLDLTINQVAVMLKDRIPRRTIYEYLSGRSDARSAVVSEIMDVLNLIVTVKTSKRAKSPRKEVRP